ncbi:hypothetical protein [Mesorhizobium sp. M0078]
MTTKRNKPVKEKDEKPPLDPKQIAEAWAIVAGMLPPGAMLS